MIRRVEKKPSAVRDLTEHFAWIAVDNPSAADRFLTAVENTLLLLLERPGIGIPRQVNNPSLVGLRMLRVRGFKNHWIFYLTTECGIDVIRVLHAARDIENILESLIPED